MQEHDRMPFQGRLSNNHLCIELECDGKISNPNECTKPYNNFFISSPKDMITNLLPTGHELIVSGFNTGFFDVDPNLPSPTSQLPRCCAT